MTLLTNNAEGGTSGTSVSTSNSGGVSGTAFDAVTIGSGATLVFDNAHAVHGLLSYKFASAVTASDVNAQWSTALGSSLTTVWFRVYAYFTANPTGANWPLLTVRSGSTFAAEMFVTTAGKIVMDVPAGTQVAASTNTIPLNAWFRVEGFVTGSATTGQVEFKLFLTPDAVTPDETQTSAATLNTAGLLSRIDFGNSTAVIANMGPFWMDALGASTVGYIGPEVLPGSILQAQPGPLPVFGTPPVSQIITGTPSSVPSPVPVQPQRQPSRPPWMYRSKQRTLPAGGISQPLPVWQPQQTWPVLARRLPKRHLPAVPVPPPVFVPTAPTVLTNPFESPASGTTITGGNSGPPGDQFDLVQSAGATLTTDSTRSAHGTQSGLFSTTTSAVDYCRWGTSMGTQRQVWFRLYVYVTANPANDLSLFTTLNVGILCARLWLHTDGHLQFRDSQGNLILTSGATVNVGSWFRVEGFVIGDATYGQLEMKLFNSFDDATATDTQTSAANLNTAGWMTVYRYGVGVSQANVASFWLDDAGLSNVGYLGPAQHLGSPEPVVQPRMARWPYRVRRIASQVPAIPPVSPAAPQVLVSRAQQRTRVQPRPKPGVVPSAGVSQPLPAWKLPPRGFPRPPWLRPGRQGTPQSAGVTQPLPAVRTVPPRPFPRPPWLRGTRTLVIPTGGASQPLPAFRLPLWRQWRLTLPRHIPAVPVTAGGVFQPLPVVQVFRRLITARRPSARVTRVTLATFTITIDESLPVMQPTASRRYVRQQRRTAQLPVLGISQPLPAWQLPVRRFPRPPWLRHQGTAWPPSGGLTQPLTTTASSRARAWRPFPQHRQASQIPAGVSQPSPVIRAAQPRPWRILPLRRTPGILPAGAASQPLAAFQASAARWRSALLPRRHQAVPLPAPGISQPLPAFQALRRPWRPRPQRHVLPVAGITPQPSALWQLRPLRNVLPRHPRAVSLPSAGISQPLAAFQQARRAAVRPPWLRETHLLVPSATVIAAPAAVPQHQPRRAWRITRQQRNTPALPAAGVSQPLPALQHARRLITRPPWLRRTAQQVAPAQVPVAPYIPQGQFPRRPRPGRHPAFAPFVPSAGAAQAAVPLPLQGTAARRFRLTRRTRLTLFAAPQATAPAAFTPQPQPVRRPSRRPRPQFVPAQAFLTPAGPVLRPVTRPRYGNAKPRPQQVPSAGIAQPLPAVQAVRRIMPRLSWSRALRAPQPPAVPGGPVQPPSRRTWRATGPQRRAAQLPLAGAFQPLPVPSGAPQHRAQAGRRPRLAQFVPVQAVLTPAGPVLQAVSRQRAPRPWLRRSAPHGLTPQPGPAPVTQRRSRNSTRRAAASNPVKLIPPPPPPAFALPAVFRRRGLAWPFRPGKVMLPAPPPGPPLFTVGTLTASDQRAGGPG